MLTDAPTRKAAPRTIARLWQDAVEREWERPAYLVQDGDDWREVSWREAAESVDEPPREGRDHHRDERQRSNRQAGGERRHPEHRLQVDREGQEDPLHREGDRERRPVHERVVAVLEQP